MILYIDRLSNTKYQLSIACDHRTILNTFQSIVLLISIVGRIIMPALVDYTRNKFLILQQFFSAALYIVSNINQ